MCNCGGVKNNTTANGGIKAPKQTTTQPTVVNTNSSIKKKPIYNYPR